MRSINLFLNTNSKQKIDQQNNNNVLVMKKYEKKFLKIFLLTHAHKLFYELYKNQHPDDQTNCEENYIMDNKIIQIMIHAIVKTEEYTLEGIAYCTRIPFDVIFDAAAGINNQLSITAWAKIVDLYMQVQPNTHCIMIDKLLEIKNKNSAAFSRLLNEP